MAKVEFISRMQRLTTMIYSIGGKLLSEGCSGDTVNSLDA